MNKEPLRLAFRSEDGTWNCYVTTMDELDRSVLLGSIAMGVVTRDRKIKDRFMQLMKDSFALMVKDTLNASIEKWNDPISAPENER